MAKKSKSQEEFENTRGELLGKCGADGGFVSSGNESFDAMRKELLTKYATNQRKPARSVPDYRKSAQGGGTATGTGQRNSQKTYEDYVKAYVSDGASTKGENEEKSAWEKFFDRFMSSIGTPQIIGTTTSPYELTKDTSYKEPTKDWTQDELYLYELLKRDGQEKADRFAIDTNNSYNKEKRVQEQEQAQDWGEKHKTLAWLWNTFSGIASMRMASENEKGNFTKANCLKYVQQHFPQSQQAKILKIMEIDSMK